MAVPNDKIASLEAGHGQGAGEMATKGEERRRGSWLWDELDTDGTTMQFGGYCLLTGELLRAASDKGG